jgi:nucleolin
MAKPFTANEVLAALYGYLIESNLQRTATCLAVETCRAEKDLRKSSQALRFDAQKAVCVGTKVDAESSSDESVPAKAAPTSFKKSKRASDNSDSDSDSSAALVPAPKPAAPAPRSAAKPVLQAEKALSMHDSSSDSSSSDESVPAKKPVSVKKAQVKTVRESSSSDSSSSDESVPAKKPASAKKAPAKTVESSSSDSSSSDESVPAAKAVAQKKLTKKAESTTSDSSSEESVPLTKAAAIPAKPSEHNGKRSRADYEHGNGNVNKPFQRINVDEELANIHGTR